VATASGMMTDEHGRKLIHIDAAISKLEHFEQWRERLSALPEQLTTYLALRNPLQWEMQQVLGTADATLRQKLAELRGVDGHT
jgi:hypothetical protein